MICTVFFMYFAARDIVIIYVFFGGEMLSKDFSSIQLFEIF